MVDAASLTPAAAALPTSVAILLAMVSILGAAVAMHKTWWAGRSARWKVGDQKARALSDIVRNGKMEAVAPFILQKAFADAFGFALDDRLIRLTLARHDPVGLVANLRHARFMVRLSADGTALVPARKGDSPADLRRRSRRTMGAAITPYLLVLFAGPFVPQRWTLAYVVALIATMIGAVIMTIIAVKLLTAWELTAKLEEAHPCWTAGDAAIRGKPGKWRQRAQARSRPTEMGASRQSEEKDNVV